MADLTIRGIGLDLEEDAPLPPKTRPKVVLADEHELPDRVVFCAKEVVFNALYPTLGFVFGFDCVRIALRQNQFRATTLVPLGPIPAGSEFPGCFWLGDGLILTGLVLSP